MVSGRAVAALLAVALPGCFFFSDFSGLDDGVPAVDAGPDTTSPPTTDGAMPTDAGDPCEGARFCDTFAGGASGAFDAWTRPFNSDPGVIVLEAQPLATAPSPPNVLRVVVPPRKTDGTYVYLTKDGIPATKGTSATLSFRIFVDHFDAAASACIAAIVFGDGTSDEHVVRLLAGKNGATVEDRTGGNSVPLAVDGTLATGVWQRVVLGVAVKGRITVTVDGATKLDHATGATWIPTKSYRAVIGANFVLGGGTNLTGFDFRFDDVRLDGD